MFSGHRSVDELKSWALAVGQPSVSAATTKDPPVGARAGQLAYTADQHASERIAAPWPTIGGTAWRRRSVTPRRISDSQCGRKRCYAN